MKALKDIIEISIKPPCEKHKKKPGYMEWQAYAEEQTKKGIPQMQCQDCGRWLFPDEF